MNKSVKKGQAALEYLSTYGWSLMLLAAVIAALLSLGLFGKDYFALEECSVGPIFSCKVQFVSPETQGISDSELIFQITNDAGYTIKLKEVIFSGEKLGSSEKTTHKVEINKIEKPSESITIHTLFSGDVLPHKGEVMKVDVEIYYYICAEEVNKKCEEKNEFLRKIVGRITTRII